MKAVVQDTYGPPEVMEIKEVDNVLNHSLSELVRALGPKGMLVPNGGQFWKRWTASTGVILIKAPLLWLFVPQQIRHVTLSREPGHLFALKELLESGKVTPVVVRTRSARPLRPWRTSERDTLEGRSSSRRDAPPHRESGRLLCCVRRLKRARERSEPGRSPCWTAPTQRRRLAPGLHPMRSASQQSAGTTRGQV
jgi:hypothetical protein